MFWLSRKLPTSLRDPKAEKYDGIHAVVNGHAAIKKTRVDADLHNALSLLHYAGRNGNPGRIDFMLEIVRNGHPTSAGRIKYYRRWLRRYWIALRWFA